MFGKLSNFLRYPLCNPPSMIVSLNIPIRWNGAGAIFLWECSDRLGGKLHKRLLWSWWALSDQSEWKQYKNINIQNRKNNWIKILFFFFQKNIPSEITGKYQINNKAKVFSNKIWQYNWKRDEILLRLFKFYHDIDRNFQQW